MNEKRIYEHFYVGSYWGPREETAQECARRADAFFQKMAPIHPTFARWYRGGRGAPRGLPGHPIVSNINEWEQLFLRGRVRSDVPNHFIEDLGFMVHVWNTKKIQTFIRMNCGAYSPYGTNLCLIEPPDEGSIREELLCAPVLAQMLTSVATAWDPDFAMASTSEMVDLVEKRQGEVRVGWVTYLSRRLGTMVPLPAPVHIEPVGELGWLLTLSPEQMWAHNPEHVAFTLRVRELLDRAGLIARPRAW